MYRTGTVSIAQGSKTLTGSGTQWLTVANILAGYLITFDESRFYEITSVGSDTSLQLESLIDGLGYQGESLTNAKYVITFPLQSGIASNIALGMLNLQEKWQQRERDISGWMSTDATTHLVESYTGNKVSIISLQELTRLINAGQYPGANAWLDGNGAPDNSIGGDGAFYLDTSTGNIYRKGSTEWSLLMTIEGGGGSGGGLTENEVLAITHPSLSANILNTLVTLNQGVASLGQADESQSQALTNAVASLIQSYQQADSQLESSFQQSISDSTTNITIDQLSPGLSAPIERIDIGGEIDIALAQITSDIENIEVDGLDVGKAIDNKTLGTSVSVVNSQVDIIKQYMDGALTNAELFDTSESVAVAQQKISTLATTTEAQAVLSTQLTARTGETEANITAQAERITVVEASADGNKSAVDALQLAVGDVDNPESVVRRLSKVESDSQGNAQAIDVVEAAVNDPDTGIAAAFVELQAVNNSISGIQATARFGVDINGNFTGIIANGNTVSNELIFSASQFKLYDPNLGYNALYYDGTKFNFTGAISASEIYGSKLATTSGTGFRVEIEDDGTYVAWAGEGPKNDTNADWYIKKKVNGVVEGFIKGEWLEGELLHEQSSTGTITTSVTHASKGKPVKLDIYIREGGQKTGDHEGVGFGVTVTIERNGTVIGTFDFNGTGRVYEPELNRTLIGVNGTAFMTDTRTVEESRTYTVTMTQYNSLNTVYNREVSIRTLENYVG